MSLIYITYQISNGFKETINLLNEQTQKIKEIIKILPNMSEIFKLFNLNLEQILFYSSNNHSILQKMVLVNENYRIPNRYFYINLIGIKNNEFYLKSNYYFEKSIFPKYHYMGDVPPYWEKKFHNFDELLFFMKKYSNFPLKVIENIHGEDTIFFANLNDFKLYLSSKIEDV